MDSFQRVTGCYNCGECRDFCHKDGMEGLQKKLDSPMPWIGMYTAAASVVCSLAMAADIFHGFRSKMLWFPCKYFSFNAMSLTLLALTLKLPDDLTASTFGALEILARVSSLVFMSTAMANFMTSLGSMDDNEMVQNLAALGFMIITVIGNVYVQLSTVYFNGVLQIVCEEIIATGFMFISLVMFCSTALTVLTTKRYIECKYQEMRKIALD
ncbi:uncharacterized protein LOC111385004 [Olea europaea subsp. europaea]|uniref:Uncharacterized protein LOC111385004 n=1 Tax=Olea europaea subsp. europaea TaxID=158383 RepID=A0A8S0RKT2_OLEEU|nr:uncharacterized protein LOC111385004 [Olea europaea subsp. europaea]